MAAPRVLATDDHDEILRLIERSLGERYECEFASDVRGARDKLAAAEFDLALCDIQMPGESGLVLAEEIVQGHLDTAVVLVTGEDDPEIAARALAFGAHGYLVKPFWPGQLLITAMSALRRRDLEIATRAHSRALEQRLQTLMDRAPVPIYIKDRERRYVLANRVAHEVAGMAPNELLGRRDTDFMPADTARAIAETDRQILEGAAAAEVEETLRVDDREWTFLTVKFPFVDDAGEIAGVSGISTDVTDRRRAEALREELSAAQERAIAELRASRQETVERLARAIELHDAGTGEHVNRMAAVAALLGRRRGLDPERVELLRTAAPMHDVGKIATSDAILRKPGPLTEAERREMQRHTTVGFEILAGSKSELLRMAAEIALSHHERWDGDGYPHELRGEEIPLMGRIVAVADVFDALLSDRSYRPALSVEEAVSTIRDGAGSHFDPAIAGLLVANLEEALAIRG
jgi:PAS domain S-box-containing protein